MPIDEDPTQPSARVDPRAEPPEAKKTVSLPTMTDRALLEDMAREVRGMRADLGLVSNDLGVLKQRVSIIEGLRSEDAMRASKFSGGIRGLSQSDDGQNMQIASLAVKVDELTVKATDHAASQAAQTAMLTKLTGILDKPMVKRIGYAAGALLLAALTAGTGYLARGNVQAPQPTIIQVQK